MENQSSNHLEQLMRLLAMEPHSIEVVEYPDEPHVVLFDSWSHETTIIDSAELGQLAEGLSD